MEFEKLLLAVRLVVVLVFAVINGLDLSFNVYAVILKETFNFTQTQVEITASMSAIGFGLAFIENILTGVFGYTTTFVVTWVTFPSACGLFAIAAVYRNVFHEWPVFVYMAQLTVNAASNTAYMVVMRVSLEIVPERFTGTFIGIFGSAVCFGKIFLAGIYDVFFYNDMAGFFWCLTVLAALVLGLCYIMIYPLAITLEKQSESLTEEVENIADGNTNVSQILHSRFFHMSFWSMTTFCAVTANVLNNITSVTDSLGVEDPFQTVTIMSVCIMATRMLFGVVYDRNPSLCSSFELLFIGYFSQAVAFVVGMFCLNTRTSYLFTALSGIGMGSSMYLPLAIFINRFGRESYRQISASFFAVSAVIILLFEVITGLLYDAKIPQNGTAEHRCYGPDCFFCSFAVQFAITILVMLVQAVNLLISLCFTQSR